MHISIHIILFLTNIAFSQFNANLLFDHNSYVKSGNFKLLTDYLGKLDSAVTAIGATPTTLIGNITPDTLSADITIPATLDLVWLKGNVINVGSVVDTITFTYGSSFSAGDYQTFGTCQPFFLSGHTRSSQNEKLCL